MTYTLTRVPAHLKAYIVAQNYDAYDEVQHAVWRFVLLNTYAQLVDSAHPAYAHGLERTGISLERIPRIEEMDQCLARFGWGAVCVDGFIPPRAFVEFQALGILPIAADMRTLSHLAYTPAPDIIHEAAGHAPILVDTEYAAVLKRLGEVGARAFSLPADSAVYRAIYALSELKENPRASAEQLAHASAELERALAHDSVASEAARLARLYWWTAEYGLIGTVDNYKIYGAGLLSSLWESHSCQQNSVKKLPLDARVIDVGYDITRPQPQLFVTPSFGHIADVVNEVEAQLSSFVGGVSALRAAQESEELATVHFDNGWQISGTLRDFRSQSTEIRWLEFGGPCAVYLNGKPVLGAESQPLLRDYQLPVGALDRPSLDKLATAAVGMPVNLSYLGGAQIAGTVLRVLSNDGITCGILLEAAVLKDEAKPPLHRPGPYPLLFGQVKTAVPGAAEPAYSPVAPSRHSLVPRPQPLRQREAALLELYQRAGEAWRGAPGRGAEVVFPIIHQVLTLCFPDEWLLRWNLLESLLKLGDQGPLTAQLRQELSALETRHHGQEPIATGLRYLERHSSVLRSGKNLVA